MINIPKGTKDMLPNEAFKWHYVQNKISNIARRFCINEIRTPVFEHTELFLRGVGETTDIVSKEMYTFLDKGERSITLKPEGTAGVARAFVESSLYANPQPTKMYYFTPVFRYEKPQNGRLREHHQFGIEFFGSPEPMADVEVIMVAKTIFNELGITDLTLNINSIGCPKCRAVYNQVLKQFFAKNIDKMCQTCKERLDKNPLRILDCKEERCTEINKDAPVVLDYLCDDCKNHHNQVMALLDSLNIAYNVNPKIVRGLDYYTKTVFEFVSNKIGAQGTVCGGGRYDGLVEQVGGKPTPAVGFGMGIERLLLTLENLGLPVGVEDCPDVYVAPICEQGKQICLKLVMNLRNSGFSVETDLLSRSLKAQMKFANKLNAKFVVILGEEELQNNNVTVKNMATGETSLVALENLVLNLGR
ncbi:MAG: histidine--tRNA ligase [Clostridia bacterium]